MKRHPALVPFSHDHRHLLFMCQQMKLNSPVHKDFPADIPGKIKYASRQFSISLLPHIEKEESFLFNALEGYDKEIDDLLFTLKQEHILIIRGFEMLLTSKTAEHLHDTGVLLETHIRKEERVLFEMIQQRVPAVVLANLELQVNDAK